MKKLLNWWFNPRFTPKHIPDDIGAILTSPQKDSIAAIAGKDTQLNIEEKWVVIGCLGLYFLIMLWGVLSEGTWDDDTPTRYFNVRNALNEPRQFLSIWNRPLFTLLYVWLFQLGKMFVVQTALISVISAFVMYRAAKALRLQNAFMVIPFIVLQTYFFRIASTGLTEPLAALVLTFGFYFFVKKNFLAFAICGSLLPLARLELSVLLVFWAAILFRQRLWRYFPILVVPTLIWNFAGTIIDGNVFWLLEQIATGEENRYGHGRFWAYFQRYIFLTGPVIFYFFMLGFFERVYRRKFDFLFLQFALGFMIYVLFSWKLSIGQAGGSMRNLISLSPFAGLFALYGYNLWLGIKSDRADYLRIVIFSLVVTALTTFFLSKKIAMRHVVLDEPEYIKLALISILAVIFSLRLNLLKNIFSRPKNHSMISAILVGTIAVYTMIKEPPEPLSGERATIQRIAEWYEQEKNTLKQSKTFVNHVWFFYSKNFNRLSARFDSVTKENLEAAPKSSIVIWDSHYSDRLEGDVPFEYFKNNSDFKEIVRLTTSDSVFTAAIFQKQ